jgi:hypothetical protein
VRPVVEQTGDWSGEKSCAQGQLQAGGNLLNPEDRGKVNGPALTRVDITDEPTAYQFPAGATGQVAVYTDKWRPVVAIRRILLRMKSWMNYVIP